MTALLGCCHKTYFTNQILIHIRAVQLIACDSHANLISKAVVHWQAMRYHVHNWMRFICDIERDIAYLVSEQRLNILTAALFENRWWRFTANHGAGFTDAHENSMRLIAQPLIYTLFDVCSTAPTRCWSDGFCGFIYSFNLHAILNKCFAVISLILKLKAAGMSNVIYAQYHTEIQDIIKHNYIIQRIVK